MENGYTTSPLHPVEVKGFTLLEAIVVVSILAVLAGIAAPVLFTTFERIEHQSTREEMENIYSTLMGNPETGSYGYLGDMGMLPDSLKEINFLEGPPYGMKSNGIGMGWNGPYLLEGKNLQDYLYDAWGNPYLYSYSYSDPVKGRKGGILIRSRGPDKREGTGDDVEVLKPFTTHHNIRVNVHVWQSGGWVTPKQYKGTVFYSHGGEEAGKDYSDADPVITMLHKGAHAVYAESWAEGSLSQGWRNFYLGEGTTTVDVYLGG